MGHGPARELDSGAAIERKLEPAQIQRLDVALQAMDKVDAEFKASRDEERLAQLVKSWNKICREIDEHLRACGKVLILSHQLSLDIGSDGGGFSTKPFIEEMKMKFTKLQFKLREDGGIDVVAGDMAIGQGDVKDVTYEWVESMVIEWVVRSAGKYAAERK